MFGDLVRQYRASQGIGVQALAAVTGVDAATISRIENNRSIATILTASRVGRRLGITPDAVLRYFSDSQSSNSSHDIHQNTLDDSVLNINDVIGFIKLFWIGQNQHVWLAQLINRILSGEVDAQGTYVDSARTSTLATFTENDIDRLIVPSRVYKYELIYPSIISGPTLMKTYVDGGVLIPLDAERYLSYLFGDDTLRLRKRIFEMARRMEVVSVERTKLNDIVDLDRTLNMQGKLLGIYWEACTFNDRVQDEINEWVVRRKGINQMFSMYEASSDISEHENLNSKLAVTLVIIARWMQALYKDDHSWLYELRNEMKVVDTDN